MQMSCEERFSMPKKSFSKSARNAERLLKSLKIHWTFIDGDGLKAAILPAMNSFKKSRWENLKIYRILRFFEALQKRLIEKNEEVVKTDMMIQEKEKMYVELREILARQPGPEVVEQLAEFKNALRHKTKQLKVFFISFWLKRIKW